MIADGPEDDNNKGTHNSNSLPSISTLLRANPLPPKIIVIEEDQQPNNNNANHNYNNTNKREYLSATLSPILSPIDSSSSVNSSSPNNSPRFLTSPLSPSMLSLPIPHHHISFPSIQGEDTPRRLRDPSTGSSAGSVSPRWQAQEHRFSLSPLLSPYYSSQTQPQHPVAEEPSTHSCSQSISSRSPSPMIMSDEDDEENNKSHSVLPSSTQIILSESGQPILKRRRGRPPNVREPVLEGGWTFLTPTVWDVKNNNNSTENYTSSTTNDNTDQSTAHSLESSSYSGRQLQEQHEHQQQNDILMNSSMAAFTSSNMDMVLHMPRKKRGRKPKTHVVGNSCFVWKDIIAPRRSTKPSKQKQQQQQQDQSSIHSGNDNDVQEKQP